MRIKTSSFLPELLWLFVSFAVSLGLAPLIISNHTVNIQLYDTYFVFPPWLILTPLCSLLTFIAYLTRETQKSFSRIIPNWLIFVSGVILVLTMTLLIRNLAQSTIEIGKGWVIYPPLSALKNSELPWKKKAGFDLIINLLTSVQFIIIAILLRVAYLWGSRKNNGQKQNVHS